MARDSKASASFYCGNLWNADLSKSDVILVYGLSPIMDRLSAKLMKEIKPDTLVISNVFQLDSKNWDRIVADQEVFVYKMKK